MLLWRLLRRPISTTISLGKVKKMPTFFVAADDTMVDFESRRVSFAEARANFDALRADSPDDKKFLVKLNGVEESAISRLAVMNSEELNTAMRKKTAVLVDVRQRQHADDLKTKIVRLTYNAEEHDFKLGVNKALAFLRKGFAVQVQIGTKKKDEEEKSKRDAIKERFLNACKDEPNLEKLTFGSIGKRK